MKKIFIYAVALLMILTASIYGQNEAKIEGNWNGTLDAGGTKLTLILKIEKTGENYAAKLDIPAQGAKDLPLDALVRDGRTVKFAAAKFGFSYEGTLSEAGDKISGKFSQGGASLPLDFTRSSGESVFKRPQTPQKPFPYKEEEVSYQNEKDKNRLAGTLTVPNGDGKFPAVVLITGSGAQDRDETIFGHKPFLVLADYLTRRGIAVLRVDDRGVGGSDLGSPSATTENLVGDVLTGVEFLKSRKEIDAKKIGLIGHSEGGIIAPIAANRSKDAAFIVMLAGTGQKSDEIILSQVRTLLKSEGKTDAQIADIIDLQKNLYVIIKAEPDNKIAEQKIHAMLAKRKAAMNEREKKEFAPIEQSVVEQMTSLLTPWYRYFINYDPRPTLEKVKVPVLALGGEKDIQVPAKENLAVISAALKKGGNKDFTVKSFPALNHLFQTSQTGLVREYGEIEETIAPNVLATISEWILKRFSGGEMTK